MVAFLHSLHAYIFLHFTVLFGRYIFFHFKTCGIPISFGQFVLFMVFNAQLLGLSAS